ncbi:MAG: glycosyltransferase family 2 protein [Candidatus Micrarchaeia archaeon]
MRRKRARAVVGELLERVVVAPPSELHRERANEDRSDPFDYTVVIPAYNESANLPLLLERLRKVTRNVIIVDDGSTDRTAKIGKRFGFRVVRHWRNLGKGAAVRSGLRTAPTEKIVLMDGDNQHSPYEIPALLQKLNGADLVVGDRFARRAALPLHRRLANALIRAIVGLRAPHVRDPLCGFRALRKNRVRFEEDGFDADLGMLFNALESGLRVESTPVSVSYAIEPKSASKTSSLFTGVKEYAGLLACALRWAAGLR